jgi:hypothetical protein
MSQKVYIAQEGFDYDGAWTISVHATKGGAEKAVQISKDKRKAKYVKSYGVEKRFNSFGQIETWDDEVYWKIEEQDLLP